MLDTFQGFMEQWKTQTKLNNQIRYAYILFEWKQIANCHFSQIFICFDYLFMTAAIELHSKT